MRVLKSIGKGVANVISDYYKLGEYFRIKWKGRGGKSKEYTTEAIFWRDALGSQYYEYIQKFKRKLLGGEVIRLKSFNLTEWFPWTPGRYWTKIGYELRRKAKSYVENKDAFGDVIFDPHGKSMRVLGGLGNVRMFEHGKNKEKFKLLSATKGVETSGGIPVVMSSQAYEKISDKINDFTTVKATITGFYVPLPSELNRFFSRAKGVPRYCLFIGSRLTIKDIKPGDEVASIAWTMFESEREKNYYLSYCYFNPSNETSIERATNFISEYVEKHEGKVLTDFDEIIPRFDATFTLRDVAEGKLDSTKIKELSDKIRIMSK